MSLHELGFIQPIPIDFTRRDTHTREKGGGGERGGGREKKKYIERDIFIIVVGNDDEMRRLGHENPTRETGSTGSNQVTFGRKGIFAQRLGRFSSVATFLPAKGARARSEHAQRNYQGQFSPTFSPWIHPFFRPFSNSFFGKNLRDIYSCR